MAITISENFEVPAAPERVWAFLLDPQQVVQCLPGAELLEVKEQQTFVGRIRVKVGPVTVSFRGRARFEEVDAVARRVRLTGEGQDQAGAGAAKMTMTSQVIALPGGGSRVLVQSEVEVVGRLVQFGRGMMQEVSGQLFRQFASCVQARLQAESATTEVAPNPAEPAPTSPATASQPLRVLPLLWSAMRALIRRLLGRHRS